MKPVFALFFIAACTQSVRAECPKPTEVQAQHLLGLWRAEFEGLGQGATLLLERHTRFAQSLAGSINRNGERGQLAGDIEDGEFSLEESADGRSIGATWIGDVVEGSCGREIRGTWQGSTGRTALPFVLRKQ
jgi:hypothetical protein